VGGETTVGIAQWLPEPGRPRENLEAALAFVDDLRHCDIVLLPELWLCGYAVDSLADDARTCAAPLDGALAAALGGAATRSQTWLAAGSVPERAGDRIFNTALLFSPDGRLAATHRKAHLYVPMGEHRVFARGSSLTVVDTPFGAVGMAVCFDGDFPEVARGLRLRGARIVLHVSAYEHGAATWWDRLYPANALANGQWWLMCNQCGSNGESTLLGASRVVSPLGEIVTEARRTAPGEPSPGPELLVAEVSLLEELAHADREAGVLVSERHASVYEQPREVPM
jgi:predicted amidohydrolase